MPEELPTSEEALTEMPDPIPEEEAQTASFPIVGIRASAGGLDAFEKFFTQMPPTSGMAFVLVQHLQKSDTYQIKKVIRDMIVFTEQNVIADPPFSKLDLVSCCNVLIYLQPMLRERILPLFHYALGSRDYLVNRHTREVVKTTKKLMARELAEQMLLKYYAPACAIIDEKAEVLYIHGHAGKYLELAAGEASLNIPRLAREGIQ